jgi:serine/threonine protein kinase
MLNKLPTKCKVIPSSHFFFQPPFYSRNTAEMYDNILNKPLQLKPNITNSARHLLEGLLQKDRTKRLGAKDDFVSSAFLFL